MCGVMCYSLYLIHLPVINAVHLLQTPLSTDDHDITKAGIVTLGVFCSLVAGICFYLSVERHFLNRATI
jgi:peptidoglycan/LPS O-acetylase OafA/YrhL